VVRRYSYLFLCLFLAPLLAGASVSITDGRGQTVSFKAPPQRIVSTFLGADEMLKEILVRGGKLHHLQAVSTLADNPDYSHITPVPKSIKGRAGDDLESLLRLKPDLAVVASFNRPEFVRRLEQAKVQTFVLNKFSSFADIEENIKQLGVLTGETKSANQLAAEFRGALEKTANPPAGKKRATVLTFMANGSVHGAGTTFDDIARYSGTTNLASQKGYQGWARLSPEVLASLDPDFLVVAGRPEHKPTLVAQIRSTPGFASMRAAKEGRVVIIAGRDLTAVSHHVVNAVTALHKAAYN